MANPCFGVNPPKAIFGRRVLLAAWRPDLISAIYYISINRENPCSEHSASTILFGGLFGTSYVRSKRRYRA